MALIPMVIEESPRGERSFDIYSVTLRTMDLNGAEYVEFSNGKQYRGAIIVLGI